MFGSGVTVLQNMASSSNIFAILSHWIPGSTNRHTITMTEKVNYNEKKLRICYFNTFNDCNNGGGGES